jgi:hypothetical protein
MKNDKRDMKSDAGCFTERLAKLNDGDHKSDCCLDIFIAKTKYQPAKQKSKQTMVIAFQTAFFAFQAAFIVTQQKGN